MKIQKGRRRNKILLLNSFISKLEILFNNRFRMKESRSCYTCQRHYYNLMSANCGHKICFHCVKATRNTSKCSLCLNNQIPRPRTPLLSPARNKSTDPKERSTRVKDSQSKVISQHSPAPMLHSKKSLHRSSIGWGEDEHEIGSIPVIQCKLHKQPLAMYCKSTRELICSVCICEKAKVKNDVVPLRHAQQFLRKETKVHLEEARNFLGTIESAQRIINKNTDIFERSYKNGLHTLTTVFEQLRSEIQSIETKLKQQFISFFDLKFKECDQISQDLSYLSSILQEYKQTSNKQNFSFNQLVYMFTSFKVIKDLDYVPYTKDVSFIDVNKYHSAQLKDYVKLKLDLPLKFGLKRKPKSQSNRSISKSKHEDWDEAQRGGHSANLARKERENVFRKHQMSLCNNVHGIQMGTQEKNLYKMLLKNKFNL